MNLDFTYTVDGHTATRADTGATIDLRDYRSITIDNEGDVYLVPTLSAPTRIVHRNLTAKVGVWGGLTEYNLEALDRLHTFFKGSGIRVEIDTY